MTPWTNSKKSRMICLTLALLVFMTSACVPVSFAAEAGNWFSNAVSSVKSSVKDTFSEVGSADLGTKPRVRPHFSSNTGWVSDGDLSTTGKDGAWLFRVAPGVSVQLPVGDKLYNELGYTYSFAATQGAQESDGHSNGHNLSWLSRYEVSKDTAIGVGNNMQWSQQPGLSHKNFFLETANANVSHSFGEKLDGKVGYQLQYYKDPTDTDPTTNEQTFTNNQLNTMLSYDVLDKLTLSPSFVWDVRSFAKLREKDYKQYTESLGASYRLGPKTMLNANIGWAFRDFEKGNNETELVYGGGVNHTLGSKLVLGLQYQKSLQDTFNSQFVQRVDNPEAGNLDTFDGNFRVVKAHRIDTTAAYNVNEKNTVSTFLGFQFINTDAEDNIKTGEKNDEKVFETGLRYSYRITRYISFDLGYTFGRRFSAMNNSGRSEYTFNKIDGGLNINF